MPRTKIMIGVIVAFVVIAAASQYVLQGADNEASPQDTLENDLHGIDHTDAADVIMPTKVSRPGCEDTDSCYVPSKIAVKIGQPVTWLNEDSAFHSVTSGTYDAPTDDFDSGYMDPYQTFTITFEQAGIVDYFCTLHPWMEGQVIVE